MMEEHPELFGIYRYLGRDGKGSLIYQTTQASTAEQAYIARSYEYSNWQVHDHYDIKTGEWPYLSSNEADGNYCPEHSNHGRWMYNANNGTAFSDSSIRLTCMDAK